MSVTTKEESGLLRLSNGLIDIGISTDFGPRVLHASTGDTENLMAELPDAKLPWRDEQQFSLRGGHRLWVAPEIQDLTYTPDDAAPEIVEVDGGAVAATSPTQSSPFRREMDIRLVADSPSLIITHRLTYEGESLAMASPWAITMLPADGAVILPMRRGMEGQLQADRSVVLWAYTKLADPLLEISDDSLVVRGGRTSPTKVGTSGVAGWSAYVRGSTALIKKVAADPSAAYPDKGAALQCYANQRFMELETLGPLRTMVPGGSAEHVEVWELRSLTQDTAGAESIVAMLGDELGD